MKGAQLYREGVVENEQAKSIFQIPSAREASSVLMMKQLVAFFIEWQFFSDPVNVTHANNSSVHQIGLLHSKNTNLNLEKTDG
jgi:hypothetical protein